MANPTIQYFLYARKSSEDKHKQIQSIDDQINEMTRLATAVGIEIVGVFSESKSAKAPGIRSAIYEMLSAIKKGKANGILTWDLSRLSRNPQDSGQLIWLLQSGVIQSIMTPGKEYLPDDNQFEIAMKSCLDSQYIIDLRKNSMRGTQSKADKGWMPSRAPLGYLNYGHEQGSKTIIADPERFALVRAMWDRVLAGKPLFSIVETANNQWGMTTPRFKNSGGGPVSKTQIYAMFSNIFYTGKFRYRGNLYQGKHKAMITMEEFNQVQTLLGRKDNPRPYKHRCAYTGLIHCGCGCGNAITVATHTKFIKASGQTKTFVYYRSTKKRGIACTQKPLTEANLNQQIVKFLDNFAIDEEFLHHVFTMLDAVVEQDTEIQVKSKESIELAITEKRNELLTLKHMRMRNFIDDEEFLKRREALDNALATFESRVANAPSIIQQREQLKSSLHVMTQAKNRLLSSTTPGERSQVLSSFGQNHTIVDGKFYLDVEPWMIPFQTLCQQSRSKFTRLQPG